MADNPFAARLKELDAAPAAPNPFAARLQELDAADGEDLRASASGNPGAPTVPKPTKPREPGYFEKAITSIGEGVGHVGAVTADQGLRLADIFMHPIDAPKYNWSDEGLARNTAERKELLRGIDDITMLGHGQRLAARIGNAGGDVERGTSLDETRHFNADPLQGNIDRGPSKVQQDEQARAPDVRPAAQLISSFALPNPVAEGVGAAGKIVLGGASRVAPNLIAKGLGYASKAPAAVKGLAGYEATAPVSAALSADAEGHRMEAAKAAATDPAGTSLSVLGATTGSLFKHGVLNSPGGRSRRFVEEHGNGAKVGLLTPGSGGVFDRELLNVPVNDKGIGIAGKKGAVGIMDSLEQQHATDHGYDYREGPVLNRNAAREVIDTNRSGQREMQQAAKDSTSEIAAAQREARDYASQQSVAHLADIDERHRMEGSEPYRILVDQIDNSPAAGQLRDVAPVVAQLDDSLHDLRTPTDVIAGLQSIRTRLEHHRDPVSGAIMVPERQLNGLRGNLMDLAKMGRSDSPSAHDAPYRAAAFEAKRMVDQGPYAALNDLYASASRDRDAAREAVGLPRRPGNNAAVEENRVKALMMRSLKDPTAMPHEAPDELSMQPFRERIENANANRNAVANSVGQRRQGALTEQAATRDRVAAGDAAAAPDRRLLGLNDKIGTRKTDVSTVKNSLMREAQNTVTAGGNPSELEGFRAAHPDQALNTRLPALQSAKADLTFSPAPVHGGLMARAGAGVAGPLGAAALVGAGHGTSALAAIAIHQALMNHKAITGRVLYTPAKKLNPTGIAKGLGVARGADLAQKMKALLGPKQEQQP